jgi:CBS domain-containing protein
MSMAARRAKERRVREIMVSDVVTIEPSAPLVEAARRMQDANVGMLPVVDGGRVVGAVEAFVCYLLAALLA